MKVKNNTNKPIGIGVLNLLPGQIETLPAPYENHPVVKMLATKKYDDEHTFLTLIKEDAKEGAKQSAGTDTQDDGKYTVKQLENMKREELDAVAAEFGIDGKGFSNKTMLAEAIVVAQGAETGSKE